jgi:hypothetical protein
MYPNNIILDFTSNEAIRLPDKFKYIQTKNMMLTAGDGDSHFEGLHGLNVETMTTLGYNIFCCLPPEHINSGGKLKENIEYLSKHPELNVIICLIDLQNDLQLWKLAELFDEDIDLINSHDMRWYLPQNICYRLLKRDENSHCIIIKNPIEYISQLHRCCYNEKNENNKNTENKEKILLTIKENFDFDKLNWKCLYNDDNWNGHIDFWLMHCYKIYRPELYNTNGKRK